VIPTRDRPNYLSVTLQSVAPQARALGAEVIVAADGPDPAAATLATRHGARLVALPAPRGANAARNAGAAASGAPLIVLIDDDVHAPAGWLAAILDGARAAPDVEVFGGPIVPVLEGDGPRACEREPAPITALDLGPADRDADAVWSANMAIRAGAWQRVGPFDEQLHGRGEEEEWLERYAAAGGRIRYLAGARLEHRRAPEDSTLGALARAALALGRTARRNDVRKGSPPTLRRELRVLAGCGWHVIRRRCAVGIVMAAHSLGRIDETLHPVPIPPAEDFLSGQSGYVAGIRAVSRAVARDALADVRALATLRGWRLRSAAAALPTRRVLVLAIERPDVPNLLTRATAELRRSRHRVDVAVIAAGGGGKFENLNMLLAEHPVDQYDWLIVLDDDVRLPAGFLDRFLFLAERYELRIAQPAHRFFSHAGWAVTRRTNAVVRETMFVEVGPVTAFAAETLDVLLPFPPLRAGWGLDAHWSAVAGEHGWRVGVVDATPVAHRLRPVAASYSRGEAIAEARAFLSSRPYTPASQARRTLASHRSW
jgi:GT2 family glycosyltransferase